MALLVCLRPQLLCVRIAAMVFTCVAFSLAARGAYFSTGSKFDWCIFCWVFSFICTLLVVLVELFNLQARVPVSWTNFPITVASYAALFCLSASVIFPLFVLEYSFGEQRDYWITSTVFSCLAVLAYIGEVSLSKARPGEVAGYMATVPGLLKVCQTFTACIIFIVVSNPMYYNHHAALKWCMAVYCICFILSMAVVVLCVGECTNWIPIPFSKFLSAYGLLAVIMYFTATILWPVYQFNKRRSSDSNLIAAAVFTALNFLLYLADLAHTARLVFTSG